MTDFKTVQSFNPNVATFMRLRVWAENGSIHIEDHRGDHRIIPNLDEATYRIIALCDLLKGSPDDRGNPQLRELRADIEQFSNHAMSLITKAREQGNIYDPSGRRDRVRRAPRTVHMNLYGF